MVLKKVSFITETEEEDVKIKSHLDRWLRDNFTNNHKKFTIVIEDIKEDEK